MIVESAEIFARLLAQVESALPVDDVTTWVVTGDPDTDGAVIVVPMLVREWLDAGPAVFVGSARAQLDALCRQIDVRRKVSTTYAAGWKRVDPEVAAPPAVVAGLAAVLLANAGPLGAGSGVRDGGWGLKCANSAFKALDLAEEGPDAPALRAWALTVLDTQTGSTP